jgi:hypothetical protein
MLTRASERMRSHSQVFRGRLLQPQYPEALWLPMWKPHAPNGINKDVNWASGPYHPSYVRIISKQFVRVELYFIAFFVLSLSSRGLYKV